MYNKLLYAIDINELNEKSFDKALALSKTHQAKLHIINVVKSAHMTYAYASVYIDDKIEESLLSEAKAIIKTLINGNSEISSSVIIGDPTETILSYANEQYFDAIILNGHSHNVFGRLGSVADRIVNNAKQDVIVLK